MKTILNLDKVKKIYKVGDVEVHALRGADLKIKKGEFVAILGPSGSGKSTLLNAVGCLDTPTEGTIHLGEFDIETLEESDLAQIRGKKIGFIFQSFNLINSISALENVELPMIFQGVEESKRKKRALDLLKMVGLENRVNHKPTELSGGQQQRVAIARALANDPEIILADEPTGNLDSKTSEEILLLLRNLHKNKKKTIVMITHDAKSAKHADRILHLHDGKVIK
ncbi:ABC transporter ATP-binding protein [archaeon]|nr:ABC transporter ATP-binding protein [archaeon]